MKLLLATLISMTFISLGTSKKCFICTSLSKMENNCTDPFSKTIYMSICDLPGAVCVKEKTNPLVGIKDNVFRGCVASDYCTIPGKQSKFCQTCDDDFCNSSSVLTSTFLLPFLFLINFVPNIKINI